MIDMEKMLALLTELEQNNNREWFRDHKKERDAATLEFKKFLQLVINELSAFDPAIAHLNPSDLIFRQTRDTRFAKHLPPYKPMFSAHIAPAGKLPIPVGYFICLQPEQSFIGGGLFASQFSQATALVRDQLMKKPDQFLAIVEEETFSRNFTLIGEKLKNVPRGYPADSKVADYLKHKAWAIEYPFSKEALYSEDIVQKMCEQFKNMKPFNDYLNQALVDFSMPERK